MYRTNPKTTVDLSVNAIRLWYRPLGGVTTVHSWPLTSNWWGRLSCWSSGNWSVRWTGRDPILTNSRFGVQFFDKFASNFKCSIAFIEYFQQLIVNMKSFFRDFSFNQLMESMKCVLYANWNAETSRNMFNLQRWLWQLYHNRDESCVVRVNDALNGTFFGFKQCMRFPCWAGASLSICTYMRLCGWPPTVVKALKCSAKDPSDSLTSK